MVEIFIIFCECKNLVKSIIDVYKNIFLNILLVEINKYFVIMKIIIN